LRYRETDKNTHTLGSYLLNWSSPKPTHSKQTIL